MLAAMPASLSPASKAMARSRSQIRHVLIEHRQRRVRDPPRAATSGWNWPSFQGRSIYRGGFWGLGDQAAADARLALVPKSALSTSSRVFTARARVMLAGCCCAFMLGVRQHGTESVNARENIRELHADPQRAVASHGVAGQAAARRSRDRAVVAVDVGDEFPRYVALPIARGHGTGVHAALEARVGVGHYQDHLARPGGSQRLVHHGREIDPVLREAHPSLIAIREAVQHVDDRVTPGPRALVAGWQIDRDIPVRGVAGQIALERLPVHLDALHTPLRRIRGRLAKEHCGHPEGQGRIQDGPSHDSPQSIADHTGWLPVISPSFPSGLHW